MIPKSVTLNPIPRILQPTQRLHPSALLPQSASVTVTENSVKTQSGTALLHGAAMPILQKSSFTKAVRSMLRASSVPVSGQIRQAPNVSPQK